MENKETLDLRQLLALCRRHFWFLLISTIGLGMVAWAVARYVITPQYTATTQILVNQKHDNVNNGQDFNNQQADIQVISTYKDIITNQVILKQASQYLANPYQVVKRAQPAKYERLADGTKRLVKAAQPAQITHIGQSYHLTIEQLKKAVTVTTQQNSQVFALNAKTDDPAKSVAVANSVARVFKQRIKSIMNVNNVTVVASATTPKAQSFPNEKLFALAGLVLGFLLSFASLLMRELFDTSVRDDVFLIKDLKLTNLGSVYHIHMGHNFDLKPVKAPTRRRV